MNSDLLAGIVTRVIKVIHEYAEEREMEHVLPEFMRLVPTIDYSSDPLFYESIERVFALLDSPTIGLDISSKFEHSPDEFCDMVSHVREMARQRYGNEFFLPALMVGRTFERYINIYDFIPKLEFSVHSDCYKFSFSSETDDVSRIVLDASLLQINRNFLHQSSEKLFALNLVHADDSGSQEVYKECFGVKPTFNAPKYELVYTNNNQVSPTPVAEFRDTYLELLAREEKYYTSVVPEETWESKCRGLIGMLLPIGFASREAVSAILNISLSSLKRRLANEQVVFAELLEDERKAQLKNYIEDIGLSFTQASYLLGYNNIHAFSRAFKKWYGVSPREYYS